MAESPSLAIDDLSGGMTDDLTGGLPNQAAIVDNFDLTPQKKLKSSSGSQVLDADIATSIQPGGRIDDLYNFDQDAALLIRQGTSLFAKSGATWGEITGPEANSAFYDAIGTTGSVCSDELNGHRYFVGQNLVQTIPTFVSPMKVYRDVAGAFQIRNAGMPKYPDNIFGSQHAATLLAAITLANDIRTQMAAHFADVSLNGIYPIHENADTHAFAAVATDEDTLIVLTKDLITAYVNHVELDAANAGFNPSVTLFHKSDRYSVGNFQLPRRKIAVSLEDCLPILRDLKRNFHFHLDAFSLDNPSKRLHGNLEDPLTTVVTTSSEFEPAPSITDFLMAEVIPTAEDNIIRLQTHAFDTLGDEGHTGAPTYDLEDTFLTLSTQSGVMSDEVAHTFIMQALQAIYYFSIHRLDDGIHVASSTESPDTKLSYVSTVDAAGSTIDYWAPDQAPDPKSPGSFQDLFAKIDELKTKFNLHIVDTAAVRHLNPASTPGMNFPTDTVIAHYEYGFVFKNEYTVFGNETFITRGAPYFKLSGAVIQTMTFNSQKRFQRLKLGDEAPLFGTAHPFAEMDASENWPTDTVRVEIYRTTNAGSLLYLVGETEQGTEFTDYAYDDEVIEEGEALYTTGNVLAADPPPKAAAFAIVNNYAYYGGTVEIENGAEVYKPRRVRQAIAQAPEWCPETFFKDATTDVVAIGAAGKRPILVCKKGVYRIDGQIAENGQGDMPFEQLSLTVGGVSPTAGASLEDTFFFAGLDGIYMTDGYQLQKLSPHLDTSYKTLVATEAQRKAIRTTVDIERRRVLWSFRTEAAPENDIIWVLDMQYGLNQGLGRFTRQVRGDNFHPTALAFFEDNLIRGDDDGWVFEHVEGLTTDIEIDRGTGLLVGSETHVPWHWRSLASDLGAPDDKKWTTRVEFLFQNEGDLSVQPGCIEDLDEDDLGVLNPIRFRQEYDGIINESRTFPAGSLRCIYKQVEIKPGSVIIDSSDNAGSLAKAVGTTVTLATGVYVWPTAPEGWTIAFGVNDYDPEYAISTRTSDEELEVAVAPAAGGYQPWQIRGVPKDEVCHFLGCEIYYRPIATKKTPSSDDTGENA